VILNEIKNKEYHLTVIKDKEVESIVAILHLQNAKDDVKLYETLSKILQERLGDEWKVVEINSRKVLVNTISVCDIDSEALDKLLNILKDKLSKLNFSEILSKAEQELKVSKAKKKMSKRRRKRKKSRKRKK